jgi:beta-lactamase class D
MNGFTRFFYVLAASGSFTAILGQPAAIGSLHSEAIAPQVSQARADAPINFSRHFKELGVNGSIVIYDLQRDLIYEHNPERNATPFLPASTFKIPNSLIALETGVIESDISVLTWDGIPRTFEVWNRDFNMRWAFKASTVWFYQVLARRIGHERMQSFISQIGYGNQNIGSPEAIDTFWLEGELRITPYEQIQFLRRLHENDLPFSEETIATVKDIMIVEQTPDYTIRAKTGWAFDAAVGWYVGYVEQGDNVYFFATNLNTPDESSLGARQEITRRCLTSLGLL